MEWDNYSPRAKCSFCMSPIAKGEKALRAESGQLYCDTCAEIFAVEGDPLEDRCVECGSFIVETTTQRSSWDGKSTAKVELCERCFSAYGEETRTKGAEDLQRLLELLGDD